MYDDDDPDYLLCRKKTCPTCRAGIRNRPIPIFVVKSIASALSKARGTSPTTSLSTSGSLTADTDPWEGLFLPDDEIEDYGSEDEEDDDHQAGGDHGRRIGDGLSPLAKIVNDVNLCPSLVLIYIIVTQNEPSCISVSHIPYLLPLFSKP